MRTPALLALLSFALLAIAPSAQTAGPVLRIFVPVGPGGTSDVVARIVADRVASATGRPVIVDNKPGATGRIAVDALKQAPVDTDTLLVAPIAVSVIAPLALRNLGYDPARDLAPVSQIAKFDYAFAVARQGGVRTLSEFVNWAKRNPDAANFGATGAGTVPHFLGTHIAHVADIRMAFVSYKSIAMLESDLAGGHLTSAISATPDLAGLHRAGKIRVLATTGPVRSPLLPDVPTFRELGFDAVEIVGWTAAFAPARTPRPVIDALSSAIVQALADPAVRARFDAAGLEPTGSTPEGLAAIIARDLAYWQPIIRASGYAAEASE